MQALASALALRLVPVMGAGGVLTGEEIGERHTRDWTGASGSPEAVLRPRSTAEVAVIMREASVLGQTIVVQGGMTGLVQASLPCPGEMVLSLDLLTGIEEIDPERGTMLVRAGTPLQVVQEAAEAQDLFFPVDLGARGSAQIGGLIATNAGGNRVLRYGMTRQSVLGLEVVLPDGRVVSHLQGLVKDNAGYDLKHLFIGAEGTLGVITRARLQLQPLPKSRETALVAVPDFTAGRDLLRLSRHELGPSLTSFEAMWPGFHHCVTQELGIARAPFGQKGAILILIEAMGFRGMDLKSAVEDMLAGFLETHPAAEAIVARSLAEANTFWRMRDSSGEAAQAIAPFAGFDISLPIAEMEGWIAEMEHALAARGVAAIQIYGHLGDGNLHLVAGLADLDPGQRSGLYEMVHRSVGRRGGSISAEHGIGMSKRAHLPFCRSQEEIAVMKHIKNALDPDCLLNRGRIFDMGGIS